MIHSHSSSVRSLGYIFSFIYPFYTTHEDFSDRLSGDRLLIRGEKKAATERKGRGYYSAKQSYGAFARAVALPCEVDADKATAKYKNGTLRLALPKTEQARAQRVKVHIRGA